MSFFDKLRKWCTKDNTMSPEARALFDEFLKQAKSDDYTWRQWVGAGDTEAKKKILDTDPDIQLAILHELFKNMASELGYSRLQWSVLEQSKDLAGSLLRKSLPYSEEDVCGLLSVSAKATSYSQYPWVSIVGMAERYVQKNGMSDIVKNALGVLQRMLDGFSSLEPRKLASRIRVLISSSDENAPFALDAREAWAAKARDDINAMPVEQQIAWKAILEHSTKCSGTKPSAKWLKESAKVLDKAGKEKFVQHVEQWLPLIGKRGNRAVQQLDRWSIDPNETISPESADVLKGLAWMCTVYPENGVLARALGDAAEASFKKIPNLGVRCPKVGNACVHALSNMNSKEAIAQLGRIKTKAKNASSRAQLEKALDNAAAKAGLSVQDLEELNVPTHGFQLTANGINSRLLHEFKDEKSDRSYQAEVTISGSNVELKWSADGKHQKSVPTHVKQEHAVELKKLKKTVADAEKLIQTIAYRIEASLMEQRSWTFKDLSERYLQHPIAATVARRLIWSINGKAGIWLDGELVDVHSCSLSTPDDAHVELWHPIASEPEEVLAWRQWLRGHEITQPFKQAHREIYVLTDAERQTGTYSNRFAAHIIRQHQFSRLCHQRGWRYSLQGGWDSYNTPTLSLPRWDLSVEFFVEPIEGMTDNYVFMNCSTDQVRFCRGNGEPLELTEILPVVFSEVMRDVDLFVSVCSIGNDPNWMDSGYAHHAYWHTYSFGDLTATAQTRRQVLQEIVPLLKIAPRCEVTDKFLVVKGDLRAYKIHLGSSNIMMEPNDEYLCIVPDRGTKRSTTEHLYLPFEGDRTLSIILSKAFLLADDKKIKDPSIVRQLQRGMAWPPT